MFAEHLNLLQNPIGFMWSKRCGGFIEYYVTRIIAENLVNRHGDDVAAHPVTRIAFLFYWPEI